MLFDPPSLASDIPGNKPNYTTYIITINNFGNQYKHFITKGMMDCLQQGPHLPFVMYPSKAQDVFNLYFFFFLLNKFTHMEMHVIYNMIWCGLRDSRCSQ